MLSDLILWLPDIKFRMQNEFGNKAANLGFIAGELKKTPHGFCLNASAYIDAMTKADLLDKIETMASETHHKDLNFVSKASKEIKKIILQTSIPPKVEAVLESFYKQLVNGRSDLKVAVRSSATAEDLPSASFAGQLDSFLEINSFPEVLTAVKKCWASLWTPRAIYYRFQKGIGQTKIGMAVIVQEMIPAQAAGVMFTANPISNSRDEYYIEAVKGLGESLVLGKSNADRYIVSKNGLEIKAKELVEGEPYLDELYIKALADEGRKLDLLYEEHQDVEWAYHRGQLYILQTRPITTLGDEEHKLPPLEDMTPIQREVWTNVNERFPEPVLPLDGIIAKIYYQSLFSAYSKLGFTVPEVDWRKVENGLFPDLFVPPAIKPNPMRLTKLFELSDMDITEEWKENEEILNRYINLLKKETLPNFPLEVIFEYLEDALKGFERALAFRYAFYIQYGTYFNGLQKLLTRLFGEEGRHIHFDLVAGQPQITTELNERLVELAKEANLNPAIKKAILENEDPKVEEFINNDPQGKAFIDKFQAFLKKYGDRELSQGLGGLAVPTWKEKPEVVWGMLRAFLISDINPLEQQKLILKRREEAENRLEQYTSKWHLKPLKPLINKLLSASRKYNAFREDSHYYLTQAMAVTRGLFLEVGKRLMKRHLLDEPSDVTYLTYFELKETINALFNLEKISKLELYEKINFRKRNYIRRINKWRNRNIEVTEVAEGVLKGSGACAGKVKGVCRIITDPEKLSSLRPGDILVAQYTNPSWTPVFSFIDGLVVEYGSTVSHAAIVAREYGLPTVMGVPGVTKILQDGQIITIDGSEGLINIE